MEYADDAAAQAAYKGITHYAITFVGTAQLSTAQKKFGSSSLLLDGDSDYLTAPDNDDWFFGSSSFTIDVWVRFSSVSVSQTIVGQSVDGNHFWRLCASFNNSRLDFYEYQAGDITLVYGSWSPSVNTWYHIAAVNNAGTLKLYIDGTLLATGTYHSGTNMATPLKIGYGDYETAYFNGWIDGLRVSKGIARWTADFTPPSAQYYYEPHALII